MGVYRGRASDHHDPGTRHDALRRWLWEHGFSFAADRPVQAAGRWYAVMAAEYTGRVYVPTFAECLFGSTGEWPEGKGYADWQKAKLPPDAPWRAGWQRTCAGNR